MALVNEWDDSIQAPAPCQPIGCDNGYHLPGCYYAVADEQADDEHRARLAEQAPNEDGSEIDGEW